MVARQKIDSRYIQDTSKERGRYVEGTSKIRGSNSNGSQRIHNCRGLVEDNYNTNYSIGKYKMMTRYREAICMVYASYM